MAARLSTGLVNALISSCNFKVALAGGIITIYSGAQPSLPDVAATGTLLVTLTQSSGAYTAETRAQGTWTLSGASGSINTATVDGFDILGGAVPFTTSLNNTALLMAAQINRSALNPGYVASATGSSAVVTITAPPGWGASANGHVLNYTATTMTSAQVNIGTATAGVTPVNGLYLGSVSDTGGGTGSVPMAQVPAQVWSGNAVATGTAGWFRFSDSTDTGVGASTVFRRYDGAVATSGAEMNLGNLTITSGAPVVISSATFTLPQQ